MTTHRRGPPHFTAIHEALCLVFVLHPHNCGLQLMLSSLEIFRTALTRLPPDVLKLLSSWSCVCVQKSREGELYGSMAPLTWCSESWTVSEKTRRSWRRGLFYKEEMNVAIRGENFQFENKCAKVDESWTKCAEFAKGSFFTRKKWTSRSVAKVSSLKKYAKVEKFWKKVRESWKKDLFLPPKNGYCDPAVIRRRSDLNIEAVKKTRRIWRKVLFYKEEMNVAIRGESFQFEKKCAKVDGSWTKYAEFAKGSFFTRSKWTLHLEKVRESWRVLKSFGKKCARVEKKTYFYNLKTDIASRRRSGGDLIWTLGPLNLRWADSWGIWACVPPSILGWCREWMSRRPLFAVPFGSFPIQWANKKRHVVMFAHVLATLPKTPAKLPKTPPKLLKVPHLGVGPPI